MAVLQLLEIAIETVCDEIYEGPDANIDLRNLCVVLLNKLCICSRALHQHAVHDGRFVPILFYERIRLSVGQTGGHFLEGLGRGIDLFSGPCGAMCDVVRMDELRVMRRSDALNDRSITVQNLEQLSANDPELREIASRNTLPDLPPAVPKRVHVLIARARAVAQTLNATRPESQFAQCSNNACRRRFFVGCLAPPSDDSIEGSAQYWEAAASARKIRNPERSHFCCYACFKQWELHLNDAFPQNTDNWLEADRVCRRTGHARVGEALRLLIKRNEMAARMRRAQLKSGRVFAAIGKDAQECIWKRRTQMLNADFALVYAASVLAESPALRKNRILPAQQEGWRENYVLYAKSLSSLLSLQRKHKIEHVLYNILIHDRFLEDVRKNAQQICYP